MSSSPVKLLSLKRHQDDRGWFAETYNRTTFATLDIHCPFVQDNHSVSLPAYTVRGLHFQLPPRAQDKLIRCIRGRIFDVALDIRSGSPTYGHWTGAELSADNGRQLFIPVGFAHGFLTLEENTEVVYKCSDTYAPESDAGVQWNDPAVAIDWPLPVGARAHLSDKDRRQPCLADLDSPFAYDGRPLMPVDQGVL